MRKLMRSALVAAVSAAAVVAGTTAPPVAAAAPAGTGFGGAYGWGHNGNGFPGPGAVGDGTNINRPTPVPLSALPDNVKQVSRGYLYGLAVLTSGSLYAWGYNGYGVLGTGTQPDGTTVSTNVPQPVPVPARITQVSAGREHVLAVADDGGVWAWGFNTHGKLGDGTTQAKFSPERIPGLPPIVQVAAGTQHSLALAVDGTVWAWGSDAQGQLGNGPNTVLDEAALRPIRVPGVSNVVQVAAGAAHSLALNASRLVLAWGENAFGRLGDGTTQDRYSPVNVRNHNNGVLTEVRWISAGEDHSLAVAGSDSSVWAWGGNHCAFCLGPPDGQGGQLGDGTTTDRSLAQHIGLPGTVQVSAGNELSAALTADGRVFGWGVNQGVRVGNGSTAGSVRTPAQLPLSNVIQVSMGVAGGNAVVVPSVAVPALRGLDVVTARQVLTASGLVAGTVTGVTDPSCNFLGLVMSSTPGAGTQVRRGSAVNLSVGQRPSPPRHCN